MKEVTDMANIVINRVIPMNLDTFKQYAFDGFENVDFEILNPPPLGLDIANYGSAGYKRGEHPRLECVLSGILFPPPTHTTSLSQQEFVDIAMSKDIVLSFLTKVVTANRSVKVGTLENRQFFIDQYREIMETYLKGFYNYQTVGYTCWSDFAIKYYGTDGNAYNTISYPSGVVEFETRWTPPIEWFKEMSYKTPLLVVCSSEGGEGHIGYYRNGRESVTNADYSKIYDYLWNTDIAHYTVCDDDWEEITDKNDPRYIKRISELQSNHDFIERIFNRELLFKYARMEFDELLREQIQYMNEQKQKAREHAVQEEIKYLTSSDIYDRM